VADRSDDRDGACRPMRMRPREEGKREQSREQHTHHDTECEQRAFAARTLNC